MADEIVDTFSERELELMNAVVRFASIQDKITTASQRRFGQLPKSLIVEELRSTKKLVKLCSGIETTPARAEIVTNEIVRRLS